MESETKIEIKKELENPKVVQDSMVEEIETVSKQPVIDAMVAASDTKELDGMEKGLRTIASEEANQPTTSNKTDIGPCDTILEPVVIKSATPEVQDSKMLSEVTHADKECENSFVHVVKELTVDTVVSELSEIVPVVRKLGEATSPAEVPMDIEVSQHELEVNLLKFPNSVGQDSKVEEIETMSKQPVIDAMVAASDAKELDGMEKGLLTIASEEANQPAASNKTDIGPCDTILEPVVIKSATHEVPDSKMLSEVTHADKECENSLVHVVKELTVDTVVSELSEIVPVVRKLGEATSPAEVPMDIEVSQHEVEINLLEFPNSDEHECSDNITQIDKQDTTRTSEQKSLLDHHSDDESAELRNGSNLGSDTETATETTASTTEHAKGYETRGDTNQLRRFYQWCNQGLCSSDALDKSVISKLVPLNKDPHPNCKLTLEEIKEVSLLIPGERWRERFIVETFFGGKDPENTLKQMLSASSTQRHPGCSHSWEDLKEMSTKLPVESLRWKFVVQTYCRGLDPVEVMNTIKPSKIGLKLERLKNYYKWCNLGLEPGEALEKAKDPTLIPQTEDPHPNCKLTWEEVEKIKCEIPKGRLGDRFQIESFFGGKDPEVQLKLCIPRPRTTTSWEDLKQLSMELPEYLRLKFMAQTYGRGWKPQKAFRTLLSIVELNDRPATSNQAAAESVEKENVGSPLKVVPSNKLVSETTEIKKLSLNQLKKYYKWCILGLSSSEALTKAKEPGHLPPTECPHPSCKLAWDEIKQISQLIPAKRPRSKFRVETFFGGKDPEEQLKLVLAWCKTERHANCKHDWEELKKKSSELQTEPMKLKFMVETFYGGKSPEETLKTLLPNRPSASSQSSDDQKVVSSSHDMVSDESVSDSEISKLSLNQLKKFYKWRILGLGVREAIVKSKEPGLIPETEDLHPNCKLSFEEIKEISLLLPPKHPRSLFQVETLFGGKDPEEQLKLILSKSNTERHPACEHTWEELKKMSGKLPKESTKMKFLVDSFYGGKSPAELLKLSDANGPNTAGNDSTGDVHFVDGTVKKAVRFADTAEVTDSTCGMTDSYGDPTVIDEGPIGTLVNGKLKLYYLWRNDGFDHRTAFSMASNFESYPSKQRPKGQEQKQSAVELRKMSEALYDTISRDRFFIHTYFGGKNPECTLKYLESHPRRSPQPDNQASKPKGSLDKNIILQVEEADLGNGPLKYYFLWRNQGLDHEAALSKVTMREPIYGKHNPHPSCKQSEDQLRCYSEELKSSKFNWDRFMVYTYYGGTDPEVTLKYFKSHPSETDLPDDISSEDFLDENFFLLEKANINNLELQTYYQWRITGSDHATAILKAKMDKTAPVGFKRHPDCRYTRSHLRCMSKGLVLKARSADKGKWQNHLWDRFVIHTFTGGKDPAGTLKYLMSRRTECGSKKAESSQQAEKKVHAPFEPVAHSTSSFPDSGIIPLNSPNHPARELDDDVQLKNYYLWISHGCSRGEAMIRAKTSGLIPKKMQSRCLVPMTELKSMSHKLPPGRLREIFIIETHYAGNDPEEVMKYLLSSAGITEASNSDGYPTQFSPQIPEAGPLHPSNEGCQKNSEYKPLNSPNHPARELDNDIQLKNYYLWINHGCSRGEAMIRAKTPGLTPKKKRSSCLVPMAALKSMSHKLPPGRLREIFIIETHYAGNDPEEVMGYLLSNAGITEASNCDSYPPDFSPQIPKAGPLHPSNEGCQKTIEYTPDAYTNPTIIEEVPLCHLTTGELKYYYIWRTRGIDHDHALANVKKKIPIPGTHFPHPNCKHQVEELNKMSATLSSDTVVRDRFFVHIFYGGKDPECAFRHFATTHSIGPSNHPAVPPGPRGGMPAERPYLHPASGMPAEWPYQYPAGGMPLELLPYQHPAVGMPGEQLPYQHPALGVPNAAMSPTMAYPNIVPPVAMVNPPSQFQTPAPVDNMAYPPYQQLIPGPSGVSCPPSQPEIAAPIIIHPTPQTFVAYSGHHQDAVGPATPAYLPSQPLHTMPRPSPPINNNSTTTATAQSQPPKAGEPLVGKHDPVQSSLKRKSTEEWPIKINLKSLQDEPKRLEKTHKKEQPTVDDVAVDGSTPMFIVPAGYPRESLSESQMDAIESSLLEAILEMDDDGIKPSFKDTCRSNGRYGITCVDEFSVTWLNKYWRTYQPWPGASLKVISDQATKIRANAVLPPCKGDDDEKILKFIDKQNKGLNVKMWTVVHRWDNGDFNTCLDLVIDEESAEVLKKCSRISFKLGSAEIITSANDSPPVSRIIGDQNAYKDLSGSIKRKSASTSHPSHPAGSSLPPPPKCILSGEGYPSPPKRLSKAGTYAGSPTRSRGRETSMRVHDDSPQRTSACRSPSQDRFARTVSKSHSSKYKSPLRDTSPDDGVEQKHSWMDWFYSKENKSTSESLTRERDTSPKVYRETEYSERARRRYKSRSPSPRYSRSDRRTPSPDFYSRRSSYVKKRRRPSPSSGSSSDEYSSTRRRRMDSR